MRLAHNGARITLSLYSALMGSMLVTLGATGCSSDVGGVVCDAKSPSALFVMHELDIAREGPSGVCEGFDLDQTDSDGTMGCMQPDFESPDGVEGIDNQLTVINDSTTSLFMFPDIGESMQAAIDMGRSLTLIELEGVDDFTNDDCLNASVYAGLVPANATLMLDPVSGRLASGQTFDIDSRSLDAEGAAKTRIEGASIVDGELSGGPFDLTLSTQNGSMTLHGAQLRGQIGADGIMVGVLGGELSIDELVAQAANTGVTDTELALYRVLLEGMADMSPDSMMTDVCQGLSVAWVFQATVAVKGDVVTQ